MPNYILEKLVRCVIIALATFFTMYCCYGESENWIEILIMFFIMGVWGIFMVIDLK